MAVQSYIKIKGGLKLKGEVKVSGAKNSVLPLLFSSLISEGEHHFKNIPDLKDLHLALKLLSSLGLSHKKLKQELIIQNRQKLTGDPCPKSVQSFRASILCLGPLMDIGKTVKIPLPGGCDIGARPIDLHIESLNKMGAKICIKKSHIVAIAPKNKLKACQLKLKFPSVGATENLIMACVLAKGTSFLENIACEPEILDLIRYLNKMGAKIEQLKKRKLKITGVKKLLTLKQAYPVIPDRIEAGTWLIAGACVRGQITVKKCETKHLKSLFEKLKLIGFDVKWNSSTALLKPGSQHKSINVKTGVYPAFPTDLQSQFIALMTSLKGTSSLLETIFENRFRYVEQLNRLGAGIQFENPSKILVKGPVLLKSNKLMATDLRAGAGLVLAGLMTPGTSEVYGLHHIERGYENFVPKLKSLGADIQLCSSKSKLYK
ncbi:MAG: UDP-N-acetylglucosamine 1-carboxyvinyltransferase [Bdellovibrionaceae bacterium]|nr:UDP-N-acetylglucosamine 1-carboxyvinyltransferase [Pseudobdellovibrionaceae bacterium]